MPETATIHVAEGIKKENGWYEIKDSAGLVYSTKKPSLGSAALALAGNTAEIEFTVKEKDDFTNRYIDAIKPAADGAVVATTPTFGDGSYVKGKDAPETRAAIAAAVALKEAVNYAAVAFPNAEQPVVLATADFFFDWLMSKTNGAAPEKGAQGATEVSATEGQIQEIAQLLAVLEKQQPASADPNWTWTSEAQHYCKENFEKASLVALTKAEANQLREHLEERIAAIQAEAGIPF